MMASALVSGWHNHAWLATDDLAAEASHVRLSIINNPDTPSPEYHWHPGTTVEHDLCAACLLSHQRASLALATVVPAAIAAVRVVIAACATPAVGQSRCASARAPPFTS